MKCGLDRRKRKALEAMYITSRKNINKRTGDIVWAAAAATFCIEDDGSSARSTKQ